MQEWYCDPYMRAIKSGLVIILARVLRGVPEVVCS